jgi:hypothetical protein
MAKTSRLELWNLNVIFPPLYSIGCTAMNASRKCTHDLWLSLLLLKAGRDNKHIY